PGSIHSCVSTASALSHSALVGQLTYDGQIQASTSPSLYPVGLFAGQPGAQPTTQIITGGSTSGVPLLANPVSVTGPHGYYALASPSHGIMTSANISDAPQLAISPLAVNSNGTFNTNNSAAIAGNQIVVTCSNSLGPWSQQTAASSGVSIQAQHLSQNPFQGKFPNPALLSNVGGSTPAGYPPSHQYHAFALTQPAASGSYAGAPPQHLLQPSAPAHILSFVGHPVSPPGHQPHLLQPMPPALPLHTQHHQTHLPHPGHLQHQLPHISHQSPPMGSGQSSHSNVATNPFSAVVAAMTAMTVATQQQQQQLSSPSPIYHQQSQNHPTLASHPGHPSPGTPLGQHPHHTLLSATFQQQNPHAAAVAAAAFYHAAVVQQQKQQQQHYQSHPHQPLLPSGQGTLLPGQPGVSQASNLPPFFAACVPPPQPSLASVLHQSTNQSTLPSSFHQGRGCVNSGHSHSQRTQHHHHHHQQQQQLDLFNASCQVGSSTSNLHNIASQPPTTSSGQGSVCAVWPENSTASVEVISPVTCMQASSFAQLPVQSPNMLTQNQQNTPISAPGESCGVIANVGSTGSTGSTPSISVGSASTGYSSGGSTSSASRMAVSVPASPSASNTIAPVHISAIGSDNPSRHSGSIGISGAGSTNKHIKDRKVSQPLERPPLHSSNFLSLEADCLTDIAEPTSTSNAPSGSSTCSTTPPPSKSGDDKCTRRSAHRPTPVFSSLSNNKSTLYVSGKNSERDHLDDAVFFHDASSGCKSTNDLTARDNDENETAASVLQASEGLLISSVATNINHEEVNRALEGISDDVSSTSVKHAESAKRTLGTLSGDKSFAHSPSCRQNEQNLSINSGTQKQNVAQTGIKSSDTISSSVDPVIPQSSTISASRVEVCAEDAPRF
ncbi:unnamed protein product, partial [Protopolystoma xenopodis]